jgi:predicted SprT family Zn-dependent metalloprotease
MQTQVQQIIDKCQHTFQRAKELYGLDLSKVSIRFDLKGRCAGVAGARGIPGGGRTYFMRFNRDMLTREAFDHVHNDTVPHEIAHIVCFMNPRLGSNHDSGWARVCQQLGGTGARTHQEDVIYGKGKTFEYTTTTGEKVRLSEQKHRKIQDGRTITFAKSSMGQINMHCAHAVVGYQGRTLAAPVQAKPATTPLNTAPATPVPAPVRPSYSPHVITPRPHVPTAPVPRATTNYGGLPKSEIARRLILSGYGRNDSREVIIGAIIVATGMARSMACNYFKVGSKQLNLPASFYS